MDDFDLRDMFSMEIQTVKLWRVEHNRQEHMTHDLKGCGFEYQHNHITGLQKSVWTLKIEDLKHPEVYRFSNKCTHRYIKKKSQDSVQTIFL